MNNTLDWTHKKLKIKDIRKIHNLYIIIISDNEIKTPLFINEKIFNDRIKSYYLTDLNKKSITRDDIFLLRWNMYITKGYYVKILNKDTVTKFPSDESKYYVSYLEIDGPLSNFETIYSSLPDKK